jgi:hypothetical protein
MMAVVSVQQSTKIELYIDLTTAEALGLVPPCSPAPIEIDLS